MMDLPNHSNTEMGRVGTVVFTWNCHPLDVEAVWLRVPGQPGLHGERMAFYWLFIISSFNLWREITQPKMFGKPTTALLFDMPGNTPRSFFLDYGMQLRSKLLTIAWTCRWPLSFRLDPFTYFTLQLSSLTSGPSPLKLRGWAFQTVSESHQAAVLKTQWRQMYYWAWS